MNSIAPMREKDEIAVPAALAGVAFGVANALLDLVPVFVLVAICAVGLIAFLLFASQGSGAGPSAGV